MPKYIDAERLEKDGWSASRTYQQDAITMVYETKKITDFPTADVVERKKGSWVDKPIYKQTMDRKTWDGYTYCSVCKEMLHKYGYRSNFCPDCGADMRGEENV